MYWQRTCTVALSCIMLATVARADLLPPDGRPLYRGKIEMFIERLPAGIVLLYFASHSDKTAMIAGKMSLTIDEPGTLYATNDALAAGKIGSNSKMGKMYQLKHYRKFDFPASSRNPGPIEHVNCAVTGDASSGYKLSCRKDKHDD